MDFPQDFPVGFVFYKKCGVVIQKKINFDARLAYSMSDFILYKS